MNKYLIAGFIILIAGLALWFTKENKIVSNLKTYADPQGVFSFKYPETFSVSGREGTTLATISIPRGYLPQTNFSEAKLMITFSSGATDATCSGTTNTSDAGAGNFYETTTSKKIYDGDCYTFEYVIHSTNIYNYDPDQGIKVFDKAKVKGELESVIKSFKYLVNSD